MTSIRLAGLALVGLALLLARPALAYYDDVHYVVTYFVARQTGYTPEQAYRIASLCVSVDYDPDTEPVQGPSQLALATTPFTGPAADPRWRFHAMRDEDAMRAVGITDTFRDCVGDDGPAAQRAEDLVKLQEKRLWQMTGEVGNPGAFLHFFQDEVPHHGYGTWWGHWPMLPGMVEPYHAKGLVIGGLTDWIAFRPADVTAVCSTTNGWLEQFMSSSSPHQPHGAFNASQCAALVQQLAAANPPPTDIDSEAKREKYIDFFAQTKVGISDDSAQPFDPFGAVKVGQDRGVMISAEDYGKLKNGPNLEAACDAADAALSAAGFDDKIPRKHFLFSLDAEGRLADQAQADKFALTGSLQLSTQGSEEVTANLRMQVRDASGKSIEVPLPNVSAVKLAGGGTQTWDKLPIGELVVELTHADGSLTRHSYTLDKRVNVFPAIKVADAAAPVQPAGLGGHWLWQRKRADGQYDLVPCYLTPQDDGTFKGVMFPLITLDNLVQTPGYSPDRVSFTPSGTANTFFVERKFAETGDKWNGAMSLNGSSLSGTWSDASGNSDFWSWIRPTPEQQTKLQNHFGR